MDTELDMHTKRRPCEHEGRNQDDASAGQGMPKMPANPQKLGDQNKIYFSSQTLEETKTADNFILDFYLQICDTINFCCLSYPLPHTL